VRPLFATVLLDPPTAMLVGSFIAFASFRQLLKNPEVEVKRTALLGAAWGAFYALSVGWMYFNYPDWMLVYLKDARTTPLLPAYPGFIAVCAVFGGLTAATGGTMVARRRWGLAVGVLLGAVLTLIACYWLSWDQYIHAGTFEQYLQHRAPLLTEDARLQRGSAVVTAVAAPAALGILALRFFRGRRTAAQAT
jgi:hypothetical protein